MKAPRAPQLDERRASEFLAEMEERARAWIPSWGLTDGEHDFGRALLEIAARFNSEVAERLDGAGEKMRRGFLDWLAVRGEAARPARMPIVFKLADTARDGVLASAPVRMQADAGGTPVVFETEEDVRIVPGRLDVVVGIDADKDAFYLPPPGLSDLKPLESLPAQWQVKSFAGAGVTHFQLDPEAGLLPDTVIEAGDQQYRIVKADKDLVTIDRPLVDSLPQKSIVTKVTTFSPFDGRTYNQQQHALYLGDSELLNIEAGATIEVVGAESLGSVKWEYWGKTEGIDEPDWVTLDPDPDRQKTINDAVALKKKKGAMELRPIEGKSARWIRAFRKTVLPTDKRFTSEQVALRINSSGCPDGDPCPPPVPTATTFAPTSPEAEGMANTTPLALNTLFYPLGKEPRQFDAFYLGSKEAFSKTGASIQLCFEMADANFSVLASLRSGSLADKTLAGVAADGRLHLLSFDESNGRLKRYRNREPLRPPSPGPSGATVTNPPVPLDPRPPFRVAMWASGADFSVAVTANGSVWVWRENTGIPDQSGWQLLGDVGPVVDSRMKIEGLVHLADGAEGRLFALRESTLFVRDLNDAFSIWELVVAQDAGGNDIAFTKIVPINIEAGTIGAGTLAEGLVGTATDDALYGVTFSSQPLVGTCTKLLDDVAPGKAPAAVRRVDGTLVAVAVGNGPNDQKILAFQASSGFTPQAQDEAELEWPTIVGDSIDVNLTGTQLTFLFCSQLNSQAVGLHAWNPFDPVGPVILFRTTISPQVGTPVGAPTLLPKHAIVPISTSEVIVAEFDPSLRLSINETLRTAVIATAAKDLLLVGDHLAIPIEPGGPTDYQLQTVAAPVVEHRGETLYEFNVKSIDDDFFVYRASATSFTAPVDPADITNVTIPNADVDTGQDTVLLITTDLPSTLLYTVVAFDPNTRIATLDRNLDVFDPNAPPPTVSYQVPELTGAALRPLLHLTPATTGNWEAGLLNRTRLVFPGADPEFQTGIAFTIDVLRRPELVALRRHWTIAPVPDGFGQEHFFVDASVGEWAAQLGDTSTNPELSWEYWNGTGWWKLDLIHEETLNFKRTGAVGFKIPDDLRPTDWSGKTNYWIRARLIGGDYGREKVTVHIKPEGPGSVQTVDRSTEGIRPPSVLRLNISYGVCSGVRPTFVLAEDSGTVRDQSDANRTPGAIVEAFIPLKLTLGRLTKKVASTEETKPTEVCPPDCDCKTLHPMKTETPVAEETADSEAAARITARELYIGLAATPSEAPVNVLLLVEEQKHIGFAPMTIEALVAERFAPIVVDDATRALGESGVLSMSFAVPPTRSELFGKKDLTWLRLIPKNANNNWIPTLRGAYLNAAWASATETLTRELLGSSDGAPNLVVYLARPPVLRDTLELRVKEPLGEEEREDLLRLEAKSVLSAVDGLPGDWVLWKQVADPDDELATARVYALDEASGEIRFGDGRHGKIPPIGRDSIVAFTYGRTEPDPTGGDSVPGNIIEARTALNLISPVETVESVIAADHAAGGAPTESDDRVLRFGFARLRHRSRVVTAEDLEDIALQSSPDIVQARAFARTGFIRLVVVMRGKNPVPNAAQIRELRRLLLEAAPASLSAPNVLRIAGPKIHRLRIELRLMVETLDHAGQLFSSVKKKLTEFFDTATGGLDKDGWALGAKPSEEEVALAISDAPYLESIGDVKLHEITEDGKELPSLEGPGAREIVMLADDPIRIQFETAEVMV